MSKLDEFEKTVRWYVGAGMPFDGDAEYILQLLAVVRAAHEVIEYPYYLEQLKQALAALEGE